MRAADILPLTKQAFHEWSEDKASRLAAALAYYTAFSLAPLLVLSVTLLKLMNLNGKQVVENQLGMLMGAAGKNAATLMINNAKQQSGVVATLISIVVLLIGASGVFGELQDSLNTIWEVQPDPHAGIWDTIKKRFLSLAMVFGVIFLLLVSLILSTVLSAMVHRFAGQGAVVGVILDVVASLIIYTSVFAAMFKVLPDVKIAWRDVALGAVITAVLFTIGKYLLTLYLTTAAPSSAYGAAGSLAALLIWVYYSAQILFFGAEFTQVYSQQHHARMEIARDAVPITEEARAQQGLTREPVVVQTAAAQSSLAGKRGAPWQAPPASTVPQPRALTITRAAPDARKAYGIGGAGLAAGFAVGAIGMLAGRKYTHAGIEQLRLNHRLDRVESLIGPAKHLKRHAVELSLKHRLDAIERRIRAVTDSMRRHQDHRPNWVRRLSEYVSPDDEVAG